MTDSASASGNEASGGLASGDPKPILLLALLLAPSYLNDFFLIAATARKEVLVIDYVSKILPLAMLCFMPSLWPMVRQATLSRPDWRWTVIFLSMSLAVMPLLRSLEFLLQERLPAFVLFDFDSFRGPEWHWFDLTAGLTLNSVSEELIYRAVVAGVLLKRGHGVVFTIMVSSLLFAGAHWSKGLANIVVALPWGMFFMAMYLKTRSLWPGVVGHTVDNFFAFT